MKLKRPLAALAAASLAVLGCDSAKLSETQPAPANNPAAPEVKKEAQQTADIAKPPMVENNGQFTITPPEMKPELKAAVDATKAYVADNRDEFVAATEKKLKELDQNIAKLSETIEALKTDVYAQQTLNVVRERRDQLELKFDELKKASYEAWTEVKAGFESAMTSMEKAYSEAKSKYEN
jgi:hypothetical protein